MLSLAITITALGFLKVYVVVSFVLGIIGLIGTAVSGPWEIGPGTYFFGLILSTIVMFCVYSL